MALRSVCAMMSCVLIGTLGISVSAVGSTLTWEYDADDNVFPNAPGQPFEGGVQSQPTFNTLVDIGGGDIVLQFDTQTTNADVGSFYERSTNTNPGTRWSVNPTVGYSLVWRVRLDGIIATQQGTADLSWADGFTNTRLRLLRGEGQLHWTARIQDSGGVNINAVDLSADAFPGFDPDAFHTFRIDVKNSLIDLYVDGVQVLNDVVDPIASATNRIQLGDVTGANDGKWQMQFLRTYQDGVIPEPSGVALLCFGLASVGRGLRRARHRRYAGRTRRLL